MTRSYDLLIEVGAIGIRSARGFQSEVITATPAPVEGTVVSEGVSWIFDVPGSGPNGATIRYAFSGKVGQGERRITGSVTGTDLSKNWPEQLAKFTGEKR